MQPHVPAMLTVLHFRISVLIGSTVDLCSTPSIQKASSAFKTPHDILREAATFGKKVCGLSEAPVRKGIHLPAVQSSRFVPAGTEIMGACELRPSGLPGIKAQRR